jgi:hypothetical protein
VEGIQCQHVVLVVGALLLKHQCQVLLAQLVDVTLSLGALGMVM